MGDIVFYSHSGSGNHGCEAIVRGTHKILDNMTDIILLSQENDEEYKYGIDKIVNVKEAKNKIKKISLHFFYAYLELKFLNNTSKMDVIQFVDAKQYINNNSIVISIGGDTYCYSDVYNQVELHKMYRKKAYKTVLWGCSVEPKLLENKKIANDLASYSKIITRESMSYEALKKVNENTVLYPDPAFNLDKVELPLPTIFEENNTIGINLSPLIIRKEKKEGVTLENYSKLIQYILDNTSMKVALIPHVVWEHNDDREPLRILYKKFKVTNRVVMIEDCNCLQLKGYISRCRLFIGARTHATIAAYSTCVPTLVVGYSVKAKGIARDIFGTYDNYVIPVQSLQNSDDLINSFKWLYKNEEKIKEYLEKFMPNYRKKGLEAKKEIEELLSVN
ncbi:polysaccharide pyruvyl transferase family protein [Terrisporobacter glycolicus]|uniref:polysaccharide pyruvyl transferase family protein n=1 Tax=Terrisporobacter petrolearius TaxID=1460447 RepID=UPI0011DD4EB5